MNQVKYNNLSEQIINRINADFLIDKAKLSMILHSNEKEIIIGVLLREMAMTYKSVDTELWYCNPTNNLYHLFNDKIPFQNRFSTNTKNLPATDFELFVANQLPNVMKTTLELSRINRFIIDKEEPIQSVLEIPLLRENQTLGVILIYNPQINAECIPLSPVELINPRLISSLLFANRVDDYESAKHECIHPMNALLSLEMLSDPYTHCHEYKVSKLAKAIASAMNLDVDVIENITVAALVHDIGKIFIPKKILNKPDKLTTEEYNLVKTHSIIGSEILTIVGFPQEITTIVVQHHERLDGSGYPQKLKKLEISLESQVLAIADVIVAMSDERCYQAIKSIDESLTEIKKTESIHFSEAIIAVVEKMHKERRLGPFSC